MTGLLSAISGQFTKSLILGALFPAAVFAFFWLTVVAPLFPPDIALAAPKVLGADAGAVSITLATLLLAGLLYNLDVPLIRLYEGYSWQASWIGRRRISAWRSKFDREQRLKAVLFELTADTDVENHSELRSEWTKVQRRLAYFPDRADLVLPTRLGNTMRAFERYPSAQYQIDAIVFWPRLVTVLPSGYTSTIDDARTSFVFLLNLAFVTALLALTTFGAGLYHLPPGLGQEVLLPAVAFGLSSCWFYGRAVGAAESWGELVKGAFDLYRWELLKQLGYEQRPRTREDERKLWRQITQQVLFGDRQVELKLPPVPRLDYADASEPALPRTRVTADPEGVRLQLSRGVQLIGSDRKQQVILNVLNTDEQSRVATNVVVTEVLPPGIEYEWGSAEVEGRPIRVLGINPYVFPLGNIPGAASATLRFSVIPALAHDDALGTGAGLLKESPTS